ncbi:hypothetical protein IMCC3317_44520 [Kordia antarctica]|uniref:Lipocalin-like domain-containing protein n=1 Tax=Kordia antarctica TaxID=1218801 RepID=A0A7L4ZR98_9FLAO|nr:hypothetical protein [Kordia antarctica]QHI39051.1 hypothetical protein IMCC3317_44520 [Kordia antarctica]
MKSKLLLFIVAILTFIACGSDKKKTEKSTVNTEETIKDSTIDNVTSEVKATTPEDKIAVIRERFAHVENQIKSLEKKTITVEESGGESILEGYFNDQKPVKIIQNQYSGHWAGTTSYYFMNGTLFFVFQQETSEASLRGPFTDKEVRTCIYDGELISVLEKEKTVAKIEEMNLEKVQNINVTEQWKSKPDVVSNYIKDAQKNSQMLLETYEIVGLKDGRWINTEDTNSGIEIKNGSFFMFTKVADRTVSTPYDYELDEKDGIEYLTLKNTKGQMIIYGLLEYSETSLVLSYLDKGSTLTYTREK